MHRLIFIGAVVIAVALFGVGVINVRGQNSTSASLALKPGTRLSVFNVIPVTNPKETVSGIRLQKSETEQYEVVTSQDLPASLVKDLEHPLITLATLKKVGIKGKLIVSQPSVKALLISSNGGLGNDGSAVMWIVVHDKIPPEYAKIDRSVAPESRAQGER